MAQSTMSTPASRGKEIGGDLVVGGVVGVQMDGDADLLFQRRDELLCAVWLQKADISLTQRVVGAALFQFLREIHIVLKRVFVALWVEDVAGVAHGGFQQPAGAQDRVHRRLHARNPVQGVEHAENVDPAFRGLLNKGADEIVRVAGVAPEV